MADTKTTDSGERLLPPDELKNLKIAGLALRTDKGPNQTKNEPTTTKPTRQGAHGKEAFRRGDSP